MNKRLTKISKYLTFILRHEPGSIGLKLDAEGWAPIQELVTKANTKGKSITTEQILQVVAEQEQPLFALSEDRMQIRVI